MRTTRRTPKPVAPFERTPRLWSVQAIPAMSTWAQGVPATNLSRKAAAVSAPASRPPEFLMSA